MLMLLAWGGALTLAFALGAHFGRNVARREFDSGRVKQYGVTDLVDFEAKLRRAQGLRPLHPNPEHASRHSTIRFSRFAPK